MLASYPQQLLKITMHNFTTVILDSYFTSNFEVPKLSSLMTGFYRPPDYCHLAWIIVIYGAQAQALGFY